MSDPIRWLHLSDFHVGKDEWAQWRLFEKIIEHAADQKGKGFIPGVVFITGDIANAGQESEYAEFRSGFLAPLLDALGGKDWPRTLYATRSYLERYVREARLAGVTDPDRNGALSGFASGSQRPGSCAASVTPSPTGSPMRRR